MQKLLALYLSNYTADRMLHEDGDVREYLDEYLRSGWKVVSVTPLGSVATGETTPTATWAMVLVEKVTPAPANSPKPAT